VGLGGLKSLSHRLVGREEKDIFPYPEIVSEISCSFCFLCPRDHGSCILVATYNFGIEIVKLLTKDYKLLIDFLYFFTILNSNTYYIALNADLSDSDGNITTECKSSCRIMLATQLKSELFSYYFPYSNISNLSHYQ